MNQRREKGSKIVILVPAYSVVVIKLTFTKLISDFITVTSFKIKILQMLMATTFLQNDALI